MPDIFEVIFQRRAVKVFDPVIIPSEQRERILDAARHAPSSFNTQPYKLYWVETPAAKSAVSKLCLEQSPAATASALVAVIADIGSMPETAKLQAAWMRSFMMKVCGLLPKAPRNLR